MGKRKPNRSDIGAAYARLARAARTGEPPEKVRKDGSIATKPVVYCRPDTEREVVTDCIHWLTRYRIFANRHDVGAGNLGAGYATYGIKGAGDIIGLLPDGTHLEIECKKGIGGRLSKGQQKRMEDIRRNNGIYLIIHGIPELAYYDTIFNLTSRADCDIL
ncbi:hypothetical protein [Neptuniibacter sp.]|uniref:hypothetical protein n=1 Tax=Neptuniibacter sp. TaxID=1962643 RepID=UPI0026036C00|nr:hypothetical protein [Neptuniibacter sp.]MCP4596228.1 hypothetical protein [Neptuniibacter sp.]